MRLWVVAVSKASRAQSSNDIKDPKALQTQDESGSTDDLIKPKTQRGNGSVRGSSGEAGRTHHPQTRNAKGSLRSVNLRVHFRGLKTSPFHWSLQSSARFVAGGMGCSITPLFLTHVLQAGRYGARCIASTVRPRQKFRWCGVAHQTRRASRRLQRCWLLRALQRCSSNVVPLLLRMKQPVQPSHKNLARIERLVRALRGNLSILGLCGSKILRCRWCVTLWQSCSATQAEPTAMILRKCLFDTCSSLLQTSRPRIGSPRFPPPLPHIWGLQS